MQKGTIVRRHGRPKEGVQVGLGREVNDLTRERHTKVLTRPLMLC